LSILLGVLIECFEFCHVVFKRESGWKSGQKHMKSGWKNGQNDIIFGWKNGQNHMKSG